MSRRRMRTSVGTITELPITLMVFFFSFLFPLIDLINISMASCSIYLTAQQTALRAAKQPDYATALSAFANEAKSLNQNPLIKFLKMNPVGGYQNCGSDLYIECSSFSQNSGTSIVGPNKPLSGAVDTSTNVYEFVSQSTYDVPPLLNLSFLPMMRTIPGIGAPARLSFQSHKLIEHPNGLVAAVIPGTLSGGTSTIDLDNPQGLNVPGTLTDPFGSSWNNPMLYDKLDDLGLSVIDEAVLTISADNPDWTHTAVTAMPGDTIYVDYHADGQWTVGENAQNCDADGCNAVTYDGSVQHVGWVQGSLGGTTYTFGKSLQGFLVSGSSSGELLLANYDNGGPGSTDPAVRQGYKKNKGVMDVRIVVVR